MQQCMYVFANLEAMCWCVPNSRFVCATTDPRKGSCSVQKFPGLPAAASLPKKERKERKGKREKRGRKGEKEKEFCRLALSRPNGPSQKQLSHVNVCSTNVKVTSYITTEYLTYLKVQFKLWEHVGLHTCTCRADFT